MAYHNEFNIKITISDKKIDKDRLYGTFCYIISQQQEREVNREEDKKSEVGDIGKKKCSIIES